MKIFQFIRFLKAIINTFFGRGAILLLPILPAVASCQHSAFFNAGDPLLLDIAPGATAAFSVRQLSSTYTGSAVEVRRASDSTTQNIGFEGGNIDLGTLTSFCNGTDCFVRTWYDQSGNGNHATQTTAANQPKIWNSSTGLITKGNKPAIRFFDTELDIFNVNNFGFSGNTSRSIFTTIEQISNSNSYIISSGDNTFNLSFQYYNLTNELGIRISGGNILYGNASNDRYLLTNIFSGGLVTNMQMFKNSVSLSPVSSVSGTPNTSNLFNYIGGNIHIGSATYFNGWMQEIIIFDSDQTANRLAIETNVNNFFSIY